MFIKKNVFDKIIKHLLKLEVYYNRSDILHISIFKLNVICINKKCHILHIIQQFSKYVSPKNNKDKKSIQNISLPALSFWKAFQRPRRVKMKNIETSTDKFFHGILFSLAFIFRIYIFNIKISQ